MRSTHLASSLEEVRYLGHRDKVSHVGFSSGRCAPVHLQLSLLKNLLQLLLSEDLLRAHIEEMNETKLLGDFSVCEYMFVCVSHLEVPCNEVELLIWA